MKSKKRKVFETICGFISMLGLMYMFGVAGGAEKGTMDQDLAILHATIGLIVFAGMAWIGGFINWRK